MQHLQMISKNKPQIISQMTVKENKINKLVLNLTSKIISIKTFIKFEDERKSEQAYILQALLLLDNDIQVLYEWQGLH